MHADTYVAAKPDWTCTPAPRRDERLPCVCIERAGSLFGNDRGSCERGNEVRLCCAAQPVGVVIAKGPASGCCRAPKKGNAQQIVLFDPRLGGAKGSERRRKSNDRSSDRSTRSLPIPCVRLSTEYARLYAHSIEYTCLHMDKDSHTSSNIATKAWHNCRVSSQ